MKTQVKLSLATQLKTELMERYGLRNDQVHIEATFYTTDLDLGRQILADFDCEKFGHKFIPSDELKETDACGNVWGNDLYQVYVHRKDGKYGAYVNTVVDDSNE